MQMTMMMMTTTMKMTRRREEGGEEERDAGHRLFKTKTQHHRMVGKNKGSHAGRTVRPFMEPKGASKAVAKGSADRPRRVAPKPGRGLPRAAAWPPTVPLGASREEPRTCEALSAAGPMPRNNFLRVVGERNFSAAASWVNFEGRRTHDCIFTYPTRRSPRWSGPLGRGPRRDARGENGWAAAR